MMMGLGSLGYGGPSSSSSSSSNLSASAPPFTVDRFNSKPNSNSPPQFPELHYGESFGHAWQPYTNPWAPIPDTMYQKSELEIDSTRITSVPLPDDYGFHYSVSQPNDRSQAFTTWSSVNPSPKTSPGSFMYESKMDSFYNPYVPSVVDLESPLVALNEPSYDLLPPSSGHVSTDLSSQVDYAHNLHGLEYGTLHGVWNGTLDGKMGQQHSELNGGSFLDNTKAVGSSTYKKQIIRGSGQFPDIIVRESSNGLVGMEQKDNVSQLVQNVFIPPNSSRTTILSSSSTTSVSHPGLVGMEQKDNVSHLVHNVFIPINPSRTTILSSSSTTSVSHPQGSYLNSSSTFSGSISVNKPSPALVIRPPISESAIAPQNASSGKTLAAANFGAFYPSEGLYINNPLKAKEPDVPLDSEIGEGSFFTSQINCQKEGNSQLFSASSVMGEVSSKLKSMNGTKVNFESPIQNSDATDGSSLSVDNSQTVKSFDIGPDCFDHHNFAVDSPCWKGVPASRLSPFDVTETETAHPFGAKIEKFCQLDLQVDQTLPPSIDSMRFSSVKASEDKVHECGPPETDASTITGNISEVDCAACEQKSVDGAKVFFKDPNLMNSKGVQFSEEFDAPREDYNLLKHSGNEYQSKYSGTKQLGNEEGNINTSDLSFRAAAMDSVLNISDTIGGAVAVRAAENVLCSPSSEEGASELANKPYGGQLPAKMDVQALLKGLSGLSDLLLFSCFTDSCDLKDQDIELINHVMKNLDRIALKKMEYSPDSKDAQLSQEDSDKVLDSPNPQMGYAASKYQFGNEAARKLHYCLSRDNQMKNNYVNHEKVGTFQPLHPPRDDLDVLGDDNLAQAMRKVLDENFHYGEEMDSQAVLFKNLWLEAEAKLCSISYRVRFDRMKMQMQQFKSYHAKVRAAASEKTSGSNSLADLNMSEAPSSKVGNGMNLKLKIGTMPSSSKMNDDQASVMARFNALKHRDNSRSANFVGETADNVCCAALQDQVKDKRLTTEPESEIKQGYLGLHIGSGSGDEPVKNSLGPSASFADIESSVMTRFHILKCRDDSKSTNTVVEQAGKLDTVSSDTPAFLKGQGEGLMKLNLAVAPQSRTGDVTEKLFGQHMDGPRYEVVKDFFPSLPNDETNQSSGSNAARKQYSLGSSSENCSSDWEHVMTDEVSWR